MSDFQALLDEFRTSDLEKKASIEERLLSSEPDYESLSDEELIALAGASMQEKVASAVAHAAPPVDDGDELYQRLNGEISAHAYVQEIGMAKLAMQNRICRVCKTNPFDVQGSSVCSECAGLAG